jgi:hypothetical protein
MAVAGPKTRYSPSLTLNEQHSTTSRQPLLLRGGIKHMTSRRFRRNAGGFRFLSVVLTLLYFPISNPVALGGLSTNLAAYWKLNESSGNATSSVHNNLLTNINSTGYAAGKINNGANFVSSQSNYFMIADASQTGLDMVSSFSLSFWTRLASQPSGDYPYYHLINKWNEADERSFSLTYTTNGGTPYLYLGISKGGTDDSPTDTCSFDNSTLNNATWYHVVVTWNANLYTANLYLNGSRTATATGSEHYTSMFNSTADLLIGAHLDPENPTGGYLNGMMDEVGIWSRVLSASEVATLYNSGKGLTYPFTQAPEPSPFVLGAAGAGAMVAYAALRRRNRSHHFKSEMASQKR